LDCLLNWYPELGCYFIIRGWLACLAQLMASFG
jgi:hypothetical protein